jgi:hypothetical protein
VSRPLIRPFCLRLTLYTCARARPRTRRTRRPVRGCKIAGCMLTRERDFHLGCSPPDPAQAARATGTLGGRTCHGRTTKGPASRLWFSTTSRSQVDPCPSTPSLASAHTAHSFFVRVCVCYRWHVLLYADECTHVLAAGSRNCPGLLLLLFIWNCLPLSACYALLAVACLQQFACRCLLAMHCFLLSVCRCWLASCAEGVKFAKSDHLEPWG